MGVCPCRFLLRDLVFACRADSPALGGPSESISGRRSFAALVRFREALHRRCIQKPIAIWATGWDDLDLRLLIVADRTGCKSRRTGCFSGGFAGAIAAQPTKASSEAEGPVGGRCTIAIETGSTRRIVCQRVLVTCKQWGAASSEQRFAGEVALIVLGCYSRQLGTGSAGSISGFQRKLTVCREPWQQKRGTCDLVGV